MLQKKFFDRNLTNTSNLGYAHVDLENVIKDSGKINALFTAINKALGTQIYFIVSYSIFSGVSTMFIAAQKIATEKNLFTRDASFAEYVIFMLYIQLKVWQISYYSHKAYAKVSMQI